MRIYFIRMKIFIYSTLAKLDRCVPLQYLYIFTCHIDILDKSFKHSPQDALIFMFLLIHINVIYYLLLSKKPKKVEYNTYKKRTIRNDSVFPLLFLYKEKMTFSLGKTNQILIFMSYKNIDSSKLRNRFSMLSDKMGYTSNVLQLKTFP